MNEIEKMYDQLKNNWDISAKNLTDYCKDKTNNIGLVDDYTWLKDKVCLSLKSKCRIDEANFKNFIKLYKKEVTNIQKDRHLARKKSILMA